MSPDQLPDYRNIFSLDGKVAVVTGGSGILGRHFCSALAAHGARLAVADVPAAKPGDLAEALQARYGVPCIGVECDVSSEPSVNALRDQVVERLGGVHVLMNNAAFNGSDPVKADAPVEEFELETWREVMAVNVEGAFLMARALGQVMIDQGQGGSIIQTCSIYGMMAPDQRIYEGSLFRGRPIQSPAIYSVSKAGLHGLSFYLASYWAKHGIRVNSLVPGGVESGQNEAFKQRYGNRIPLGRMARAEEIVGAAVWLASDASTYVTGQAIHVDGGLSAW